MFLHYPFPIILIDGAMNVTTRPFRKPWNIVFRFFSTSGIIHMNGDREVGAMTENNQMNTGRDSYRRKAEARKQGQISLQAGYSIFLNLFMRKEYLLQLYKELFPQDTGITEKDLRLVTLDNVLAIHPYNDLAVLAGNKLIVLAQAQANWSVYTVFRLADCYFDAAMDFLQIHDAGSLNVEVFVIYTGNKHVENDILSLNQEFFGGDPNKPFKARIIHGEYNHGILGEYMNFCRIFDATVRKVKAPEEKLYAVATAIDLCIENNCLAGYLTGHRSEAEKIMLAMFSPEYVKMASERAEKVKASISTLRFLHMQEEQIKDIIEKQYGLAPAYIQSILDESASA